MSQFVYGVSMISVEPLAAPVAWRFFDVEVRLITRLSPTFIRVTLTGHDLDQFADLGYDARVKMVLPDRRGGYEHLPRDAEWFHRWRRLAASRRNPLRTYTTRAVRSQQREVDIDMVLHGDMGVASRWVQAAEPGDRLVLLGPNVRFDGSHGGVEFEMCDAGQAILLAGDETAVPAIAAILSQLHPTSRGAAIVEVPDMADRQVLDAPAGVDVTWLPRNDSPHGKLLVPHLQQQVDELLTESGDESGIAGTKPESSQLRAWLAGESRVVRTLRRQLVAEREVDRNNITFMGYWKRGVAGG